MHIKLLLSLFLITFSIEIHAIHFKHLGPEDGLAHPAVLSIFQDSIGRIWFGTEEGISIYDGNQLTSYQPYQNFSPLPLFQGEIIKEITATSGNDIFFTTNKALIKYDICKETFNTIWEKNRIHSIHSHKGVLWIATSYELYRWDDQKQQLALHNRLPFEISNSFLIDRLNRKWFATSGGIFRTTDDMHFEKISDTPGIASIFMSSHGDIWAGSRENGLLRIRPDGKLLHYNTRNSASKGLYSDNIRKITEDANGNIWFGTFSGLYKFNPQKETFVSYTREDRMGSITHSSVYAVFIDKEDILWAGTYFGGVNYASIRENSFTFYNTSDRKNYLSNPVVGSITEDSKGNIWICTEGGGLNMLQPETGKIKRFTSNKAPFFLPHTNLKSILYDEDKELLYIGTNSKGLYSYDIRRNNFKHEIEGIGDSLSTINAIARDGERLFLACNKKIFIYSLKDRKVSLLYQSNDIASAHIRIDTNRNLWVIEGNRIHLFNLETLKHSHTYDLSELGIYSRIIRTFQSSKKETYICTHGNGVMRLDTLKNRFEVFPSQTPLPLSNYCYQIGETSSGNLIITGNKGITILNKKGEIQQSLLLDNYFPVSAFTRDCGLFISRKGTIYAGGTNGMVSFSEAELAAPTSHCQLYFTKLYVHENLITPNDPSGILIEGLPFTNKIVLTHEQNKIEILFTSQVHVPGIDPVIYEYKLQGLDKTWYQTTRKSISYTNLPPGDYLLEVREKSLSAENPKESRQLHIVILPPWYATWWAWTIWICLCLFLTGTAVHILLVRRKLHNSIRKEQMEKQQMKEINEAKFRFFTSVSHEFRTPLTLIIGQLELLLQEHKIAPSTYNRITKVVHQAQHLSNLVTELIEFRKYEQERMNIKVAMHPINGYMNELYDSFRELALLQNIKYSLHPCEEDIEVCFDKQQMLKVLYNLLSNAFKYTPKNGEISISLLVDQSQNKLYIRIMDSGVGMNSKDLEHIFDRFYQADNQTPHSHYPVGTGIGLALAKSVIEAHKGTIEVKSQAGYGSIFTITLLLGTEHLRADKHVIFDSNVDEGDSVPILPSEQYLRVEDETGQQDEGENSDIPKATVILIEDNTELLDILANIFSPFYHIRTATNGKEGYDLIREVKPDLIVSDIMMPVMTGTELCIKVKNDLELCHIPVVLLTALNMPEQTIEGLIRGADDYICKPFNAQVLLARCNNIVRSRKMLYKLFTQKPDAEISVIATNKLDQEFMEKITTVIDENLTDSEFNIDKLASEMCMGRSTFYNKFKALTGVSPNDFINSYKLRKAVVLLKNNPELSISEIADNLGYNTVNYFCRKFKEQFNMPPSRFRTKDQKRDSEEEEKEE